MSAGADKVAGILNQLLQSNVRIEKLMEKDSKSKKGEGQGDGKGEDKGGGGGGPSTGDGVELATSMSLLIDSIKNAKGVKEKTGKALKSIITDVGDALAYAAEKMKDNTANDVISFFELIVDKGGKFLALMLLWGVTGPIAMAGGALFSLTVVMMAGIFQKLFKATADVLGGVETIVNMGKAAAIFGLAMIGYSLVAPLIAIGALFFSLIVTGMTSIFTRAKAISPKVTAGIQAVLDMAKGAALFGVAMILYALAAPLIAIGALAFVITVTAMTWVLKLAFKEDKDTQAGIRSILGMAYNAVLFGLAMIGYALTAPLIAKGALVFVLVVGAMLLVFGILAKKLPEIDKAADALKKMVWPSVIFLGLFILASMFVPQIVVGALLTIATIGAMIFVFGWAAKKFPEVKVGAKALKTMQFAIPLIMGTVIAVGYFWKEAAIGALITTLSILGIGYAVSVVGDLDRKGDVTRGGKALKKLLVPLAGFAAVMIAFALFSNWSGVMSGVIGTAFAITTLGVATAVLGSLPQAQVYQGVEALKRMIAPMIGFAVGIAILGRSGDWKQIMVGVIAMAASIAILGTAAAILGELNMLPIPGAVMGGALVLLALSGAMLVFSGAIKVLSTVKLNQKQVYLIGELIGVLAEKVAYMGLLSIGVVLGSVAMITLAGGLYALSAGLKSFKKVGWKKQDTVALELAISGVLNGFANAGLWTIAKARIGASAVTEFAKALFPLSKGLIKFKEVNFNKQMGKDMQEAISSLFKAFSEPFKELSIGDYFQITAGLDLIGSMGNAIAKLAEGVADMANLTVTEYEVVNAGTDKAKIVPKGKRQLSRDDFKLAADGVRQILFSLIEPIKWFGYTTTKGEEWFTDGYVEKGLDYLGTLSSSMVNLAEGVAKMANLEVTNYEVKNGKLVPKKTRKLKNSDFSAAATNVKTILKALSYPIRQFGKDVTTGEWGFKDGYMAKGLDALYKVSKTLTGLAEGVAKMSNLEVVEYTIKNNELVPKKNRKLKKDDFKNAGINVGKLTHAIAYPLAKFGKMVTNGEGDLWGDGYIQKGIEALGDLTDPLGSLADMIVKLGSGQFEVKKIVKDPKTGIPKLVTDKLISPSEAMGKAKKTLSDLLSFIPYQMVIFGKKWEAIKDKVEPAIDGLDSLNDFMESFNDISKTYTNILKQFAETEKIKVKPHHVVFNFAKALIYLGKTFNKDMKKAQLNNFKLFNTQIERLARVVSPFEKFTKSFGEMSKHMGVFAKNFKIMDPIAINAFKDWSDSMIMVSKIDISKSKAIIDFVNGVVDGAFGAGNSPDVSKDKKPQDYNETEKKKQTQNSGKLGGGREKESNKGGGGGGGDKGAQINTQAIANAITTALRNLTVQSITVKGDIIEKGN